ncbi:/ ktrB / Ktr system potassium uptake protein B /:604517 Reverse [Candidatus Hepatoplasma crinochetorum]|uniref:/ ktrB / Ktr system potassium uptake protein B /:604517 Reverse n=1 Tax=Candidatus Hepatoplasma crinochetorum TaxID=295596 RepID=A0A0G7ZNF9_9MOLU|nr:/ ktrB / Ktr system potassium uptake protein B /:604517 Reverse [Candidatus Hepatoplasma crinochetorum]
METLLYKKNKINHNEILIPKKDQVHKRKIESGNKFQNFIHKNKAILTVLLWYLFFLILGGILLYIPVFQKDDIDQVSFINSLFISASAFSDTGLSTVAISETYNFFGQFIIFILILIGGIGWFTIKVIFVEYIFEKKITIKDQGEIMNEIGGETNLHALEVAKTAFISTVIFIVVFGFIFAGLFYSVDPKYPSEWTDTSIYPNSDFPNDIGLKGDFTKSLWTGIFHTGSSINNAGFDIFAGNYSLAVYYQNYFIQFLTIFLFVFGGIGFAVIYDCYNYLKNKAKGQKFRFSIFTKIAALSYFSVAIIGLLLVFTAEGIDTLVSGSKSFYQNELYGDGFSKSYALIFNTFSTRNAGFSTINLADLSESTKVIYVFMMFIGSGPGSTAGGIRTTTLFILVIALYAKIKGKKEVSIFNRRISNNNVNDAFKIFIFSVVIVFASSFLIYIPENVIDNQNVTYIDSLFVSASAYGTTGLATKNLEYIDIFASIILIIVMFIGQFGIYNTLNIFKSDDDFTFTKKRHYYRIYNSKYLETEIRLG